MVDSVKMSDLYAAMMPDSFGMRVSDKRNTLLHEARGRDVVAVLVVSVSTADPDFALTAIVVGHEDGRAAAITSLPGISGRITHFWDGVVFLHLARKALPSRDEVVRLVHNKCVLAQSERTGIRLERVELYPLT